MTSKRPTLTKRQQEVLALLVQGNTMIEVAAILKITPRTVAFHKYRIMSALEISSNTELIRYAIKRRIVQRLHDQKWTTETLDEGKELLRQITENIQEVFFVVDHKKYRVLYVSPSYEKIWGQTCESLLKDPTAWIEAIIPEDRERVSVALGNQQRTGEFNEEFRIVRPDKSIRWIHDRVFPIRNARGEVYRLVGIALDITARRRAEIALEEAYGELDRRVQERTQQLQKTQKELFNLSRHLIRAQEEERRRIALELHDQFGQDLALLSIEIEQLKQKAPQFQAKQLQKLTTLATKVASQVQTLSHRLHPSTLAHLGLVAASKGLCNEVTQSSDIQINFSHSDVSRSIPQEVSTCLFRVLQESLTNVVKHSGAKTAQVELAGNPSEIQLQILDSGVGFDPKSTGSRGGLGLISMRERLSLLGGELLIESRPSGNTWIKACVPLKSSASPTEHPTEVQEA